MAWHFHTPDRSVAVTGSDEGQIRQLCIEWLLSALRLPRFSQGHTHVHYALPELSYLQRTAGQEFKDTLRTWIEAFDTRDHFLLGEAGERVLVHDAIYNTALTMGNDEVRAVVRLHAGLSYACYVEEAEARRLADLLSYATDHKLLLDAGWDNAIAMLYSAESAVMCSGMERAGLYARVLSADLSDPLTQSDWDGLSERERFNEVLFRLRADCRLRHLNLTDLQIVRFGTGYDGFQIATAAFATARVRDYEDKLI